MKGIFRFFLRVAIGFLIFNTLLRIFKKLVHFPMPDFLVPLIDNPVRRRFMPPAEMAVRHGVRPEARVLEIGPGNGSYTLAAAQLAGPKGEVVAIDVSPKIIERVINQMSRTGVENVDARVGNVTLLPFAAGEFDAAYMMMVLGELPDPARALSEIHRTLSDGGTLAISEGLVDPDYSLESTVTRLVEPLGFRLKQRHGNFWFYTLVFEKMN